MSTLSASTSTHHIHIADESTIKATHSISLDTATLGIESDGINLTLFIWGNPAHVWDNLDAIIDACAALKVDIARRSAAEIAPPTLIVV